MILDVNGLISAVLIPILFFISSVKAVLYSIFYIVSGDNIVFLLAASTTSTKLS